MFKNTNTWPSYSVLFKIRLYMEVVKTMVFYIGKMTFYILMLLAIINSYIIPLTNFGLTSVVGTTEKSIFYTSVLRTDKFQHVW